MIQIRQSLFETNSSSTHALALVLKSDYDRWIRGEMLYSEINYYCCETFVTRERAVELIKERCPYLFDVNDRRYWKNLYTSEDEMLYKHDFYTAYNIDDKGNYIEEHLTTPSGDKVVAFSYYSEDY